MHSGRDSDCQSHRCTVFSLDVLTGHLSEIPYNRTIGQDPSHCATSNQIIANRDMPLNRIAWWHGIFHRPHL